MDEKVVALLDRIEALNESLKNGKLDEYRDVLGNDIDRFNFSQISKNAGHLLYDLVNKNHKKSILELGTSAAYSTIWLASACTEYGGKVVTIENDRRKIFFAKKHVSESGLDSIEIIEGDILEVLKSWNRKIDFLFIDAQKSKYLEYFKIVEEFLEPECIIVADNVKSISSIDGEKMSVENKTKEYVEYLFSKKEYENEFIELGGGMLLSQKSNARS